VRTLSGGTEPGLETRLREAYTKVRTVGLIGARGGMFPVDTEKTRRSSLTC
jgi:hypothetical protein